MLGPFHTFMTGDTMEWFEKKGISLKIEDDGRIFPESNSSQTIINCFIKEVERLKIEVLKQHPVKLIKNEKNNWLISTENKTFICRKVLVATGSNSKIWNLLKFLGHSIVPPVPSLFTFNINDSRIKDLPGVSTMAAVSILSKEGTTKLNSEGPLLITHWGLSGPAILKLSAWGAVDLFDVNYQFKIKVNWLKSETKESVFERLKELKNKYTKKSLHTNTQLELPKRLWQNLLLASKIYENQKWAETNHHQLKELASQLTQTTFHVQGKSTFKEEFVTAGGINLKEINFKRYESKIHKGLFFAGEVLNIDAITGGFNFQNAWTGGFIAAKAIASMD